MLGLVIGLPSILFGFMQWNVGREVSRIDQELRRLEDQIGKVSENLAKVDRGALESGIHAWSLRQFGTLCEDGLGGKFSLDTLTCKLAQGEFRLVKPFE